MESNRFVSVLVTLFSFAIVIFANDFDDARTKINAAKPNIDYKTFCSEAPAGGDKIACRIKDVPTVGFLVCKTFEFKEEDETVPCSEVIESEMKNIEQVKSGGVSTVEISRPAIHGVKCGENSAVNCSGFLERWWPSDKANFEQVGDLIGANNTTALINAVKGYTSQAELPKTAGDLTKIKNYMIIDEKKDEYRQICDLQGFFLVQGGFLVADVPDIRDPTDLKARCWKGEPTTEEVLDALKEMISAFSAGEKNNANRSTGRENASAILLSVIAAVLMLLAGRI